MLELDEVTEKLERVGQKEETVDLEEAVDVLCSFSSTRQGHLLGKSLSLHLLVRNTQDSILLALLSYISAITVTVFINYNFEFVISVALLNSFSFMKLSQ